MIISCKVALRPNKEQEAFFWKCANIARFVYNFSLNTKAEAYKNGVKLDANDISKYITQLKNTEDYFWLQSVPFEVPKQAVRDMDDAFKRFFKGAGYPRFKRKSRATPSFYTRYDRLHSIDNKHIKVSGLKQPVKTYESCLINGTPRNPRIKYDGKYWYLTYGVELIPENSNIPILNKKIKPYGEMKSKDSTGPLGIDLGISHTAVCSDGKVYENVNKTPEMKRLKQKKKRLQQQISRKYQMNKQGDRYVKTKNIIKQEKKLRLVERRISNIRDTYINQMTSEMVKTKPSKIVIEDLAVSNMLKNRHLAKYIQEQCWYEIRRQLEYKGQLYNVPVQIASRFYPSTKTCSNCGGINRDITLEDRVYECTKCGFTIDRDYNASINLSRL